MSLSSTTSDGAKRITSGPALSTMTPSCAAACRKSRAAFILRLQLGANQQPHSADFAEDIKLFVNLLKMFHKQIAFRIHAIQDVRRINDIERRTRHGTRQRITAVGGAV